MNASSPALLKAVHAQVDYEEVEWAALRHRQAIVNQDKRISQALPCVQTCFPPCDCPTQAIRGGSKGVEEMSKSL